jgi:hypothetical protein
MEVFFAESRCGGWGFIIRDSDGDTVWSGAGGVAHAQDALQTEAEACIQAMPVAQQYGMTKFIRLMLECWFRLSDKTTLMHTMVCSSRRLRL